MSKVSGFVFRISFVVIMPLVFWLGAVPICGKTFEQDVQNNAKAVLDRRILGDESRLRYDSQVRAKQLAEKRPTKNRAVAPLVSIVAGELPAFEIFDIRFNGCTKLADNDCAMLVSRWRNKKMNVNDINTLISDITRAYLELGFVTTRVFLPRQNLKEGKLTLEVQEGVVESIRVAGLSEWQVGMGFPDLKGKVLNVRDLEQGVDQLNKLGSTNLVMTLVPSTKNEGATIVDLKNRSGRKTSGGILYDTYQDQKLGFIPNSFYVSVDSPLGMLDQLDMNYSQKYQGIGDFQSSYSVKETWGWGYFSPYVSYSFFDSANLLTGTNRGYIVSGTSETMKAGVDIVVYRNQTTKTNLKIEYGLKNIDNFLEKEIQGTNSNQLSFFDFGLKQVVYGGNSVWTMSLDYILGQRIRKFTQEEQAQFGSELGDAQSSYKLVSTSCKLSTSTPLFGLPATTEMSVRGQYAITPIITTEGTSLGDYYNVGGFSSVYSSDSGVVAAYALSYPATVFGYRLAVSHGVDTGVAWNNGFWEQPNGHAYGVSINSAIQYATEEWAIGVSVVKGVYASTQLAIGRENYYMSVTRSL